MSDPAKEDDKVDLICLTWGFDEKDSYLCDHSCQQLRRMLPSSWTSVLTGMAPLSEKNMAHRCSFSLSQRLAQCRWLSSSFLIRCWMLGTFANQTLFVHLSSLDGKCALPLPAANCWIEPRYSRPGVAFHYLSQNISNNCVAISWTELCKKKSIFFV